jgi:hypothetical protein
MVNGDGSAINGLQFEHDLRHIQQVQEAVNDMRDAGSGLPNQPVGTCIDFQNDWYFKAGFEGA